MKARFIAIAHVQVACYASHFPSVNTMLIAFRCCCWATQHLRGLNNFNGMLTVVGALESPAVLRLTETNTELKRKRSSLVKLERELLALAQAARDINKEMLASPKLPGIPSLYVFYA